MDLATLLCVRTMGLLAPSSNTSVVDCVDEYPIVTSSNNYNGSEDVAMISSSNNPNLLSTRPVVSGTDRLVVNLSNNNDNHPNALLNASTNSNINNNNNETNPNLNQILNNRVNARNSSLLNNNLNHIQTRLNNGDINIPDSVPMTPDDIQSPYTPVNGNINQYSNTLLNNPNNTSTIRFDINNNPTTNSNIDVNNQNENQLRLSRTTQRVKTKILSIELVGNRTIFMPGQRVEGILKVCLAHQTPLKLLRVRFSGVVQTCISKTDAVYNFQNGSSITLFKEILTFMGSSSPAEPPIMLEPGEHIWPFVFRVPATELPPSFVGPFGRIRYEVAAVLVRPNFSNKITSVVLSIPSTHNPDQPEFFVPESVSKQIKIGWLTGSKLNRIKKNNSYKGNSDKSYAGNDIKLFASIPKKAFKNEETIPLAVKILNFSSVSITLKDVSIKQYVTYYTQGECRGPNVEREHKLLMRETYPPVTTHDRLFHVPIPQASIMSASIDTALIQVSHKVSVNIIVPSSLIFTKTIKIEIPITICGFPCLFFDTFLQGVSDGNGGYIQGSNFMGNEEGEIHFGMEALPVYDGEHHDEEEEQQREIYRENLRNISNQSSNDNINSTIMTTTLVHNQNNDINLPATSPLQSLTNTMSYDAMQQRENTSLTHSINEDYDNMDNALDGSNEEEDDDDDDIEQVDDIVNDDNNVVNIRNIDTNSVNEIQEDDIHISDLIVTSSHI